MDGPTNETETYKSTARIIKEQAALCGRSKFLVAIAGAPGSGKSTIAGEIVKRINSEASDCTNRGIVSSLGEGSNKGKPHLYNSTAAPIQSSQGIGAIAVSVGMDGFHYPRSHLDAMPNREQAYRRRGAPWTFDVDALLIFVRQLRQWADGESCISDATSSTLREASCAIDEGRNQPRPQLTAPSFSHAIKDPVPDAISIFASTTIVILEGNYLLLDEDKWRDISALVDFRIFVDVDFQLARMRVARRHVQAGIEASLEGALGRFDGNDLVNGRLVQERLCRDAVDLVVVSKDH
ncbi:uncharacterized protein Z520_06180 [Fonsecaea multimorphosa CBS 102226]|uniref:Phosphoribulokinase/uridine kinase domain-containing protein n=1 Tax=Fonsecaea multimorphosa CBS 102226 TaxID=1442371 RepID=A0A0D2H8B8_9EURO|nr:uncharacterized protein Z520_06180 [Fonsecaea multimorphosa CBS 102226]KIX98100.1 hypothetical protein Z520_06180 [Fonsecaea multimorphosa CBS 102226]OAL24180.1 hypothetical protein AYO22_05840 [Fonsecaea multimorphosa]